MNEPLQQAFKPTTNAKMRTSNTLLAAPGRLAEVAENVEVSG